MSKTYSNPSQDNLLFAGDCEVIGTVGMDYGMCRI